jgi:hypothetical protein
VAYAGGLELCRFRLPPLGELADLRDARSRIKPAFAQFALSAQFALLRILGSFLRHQLL